jgi:hypothetical protein
MAPGFYPQGAPPSLPQRPPQNMQKVNHPFQQQQQQQQQMMRKSYHPNQEWSTHYMTNKMSLLVPQHPKSYYDAFVGLSNQHQFVMNSTVVFRFAPRPALRGTRLEDRAMFFLKILKDKKNNVADKPAELIGLRCACCFQVIQYVSGSSNFVDVSSDLVVQKLKSAVVGRLSHMASCRYVTVKEQRMLSMYKPRQSESEALIRFLTEWHKVLYSLWFQDYSSQTTTTTPLNGLQPLLMGNRSSYFDFHPDEVTEEDFYDDLLTSMTAARYMKRGEVVFDDLAEGPVTYDDCKETPLMETFLQNYQLRVKRRNHQLQIRIHCQHCTSRSGGGGSSHGISSKLLSSTEIVDDEAYKDMSKQLWRFAIHHSCRECQVMPTEVKVRFQQGPQDPPLANLLVFFKAWKAYLQQILRWTKVDLAPKPETGDVYLPLSKEQMQRYEPIECQGGQLEENNKPRWSQPQNCGPDDVILDSEAHRDWGGNRKFRQLISKHRGIYDQSGSSPSQQQLIVQTLTDLIFKKGGKFCKLDNMSFAYNIGGLNSLAHVTHCLRNGFPEMLRPPLRLFRGSYKVYQVVFPPKVGVLHGNVRWGNTMSPQVKKLTDYAEREGYVKLREWRRVKKLTNYAERKEYVKFPEWRKSVASASQPTRTTGARSETSETSESLVTEVEEAPQADDSKSAEENATEHVPHNHKLSTAAAEKRSQQSRSDEVTFPKPSTDVPVSSKHRTSNACPDVVDLTAPDREESPSPDELDDCQDKNRARRNQPLKRKSPYDYLPQSPAKAGGVSHHGTPNHGRSPVVSTLSSAFSEDAGREIKRLRPEGDTEDPPSTAGIVSGGLLGHHNPTEENALTWDNPSETDVVPTNSEHGFSTQTKSQSVVTPTIKDDQKKGTSPSSAGIRDEADVEIIVIDDSSDSDGRIELSDSFI